jgi:hypothetical protein
MHDSIHAIIAAQVARDRITEATSARRSHETKPTRERTPKLHHVRRWLGRPAPAPTATAGSTIALPPS